MPIKKPRVLIACGPTREAFDPVRFLSNRSTGIMGLEIAKECKAKAYPTTILHGQINGLSQLSGKKILFESALDLQKKIKEQIVKHDVLFMVAAVADFRPSKKVSTKIRRSPRMKIDFVQNPDILKSIKKIKNDKCFIGFSIETSNTIKKAQDKLKSKGLDWIVAQKVSKIENPFGANSMNSYLLGANGDKVFLGKKSKRLIAKKLVELIS